MAEKTQVSVRVDAALSQAFDEIARRRRLDTGEHIGKADLLREAMQEYVSKRLPERQD